MMLVSSESCNNLLLVLCNTGTFHSYYFFYFLKLVDFVSYQILLYSPTFLSSDFLKYWIN
ncbi:hypothetical protein [Vibrio vulnificus YJ016]|uniref:Uncharacterized protein n=1 Tax=Vibrio vulnificus (strain YJ016) TaxID=196600 RepID=Q7MKL9_VIBVY|nr:hypothetical protein [Vibrio vulnificus YJ016]